MALRKEVSEGYIDDEDVDEETEKLGRLIALRKEATEGEALTIDEIDDETEKLSRLLQMRKAAE